MVEWVRCKQSVTATGLICPELCQAFSSLGGSRLFVLAATFRRAEHLWEFVPGLGRYATGVEVAILGRVLLAYGLVRSLR